MSKLEVTASNLAGLVNPVLPFACQDDYVPILNAVRIFTIEGRLAAIATDRYKIGLQISDIKAEGIDAVVPSKGLKAVLRTFRVSRSFDPSMELHFTEDSLSITGASKEKWLPSQSLTLALAQGNYPDLAAVITSAQANAVAGSIMLDPKQVAAFPPYSAMSIPEIPNKPVVIHATGSFVGLLMPLRSGDNPVTTDPAIAAYLTAGAK